MSCVECLVVEKRLGDKNVKLIILLKILASYIYYCKVQWVDPLIKHVQTLLLTTCRVERVKFG